MQVRFVVVGANIIVKKERKELAVDRAIILYPSSSKEALSDGTLPTRHIPSMKHSDSDFHPLALLEEPDSVHIYI